MKTKFAKALITLTVSGVLLAGPVFAQESGLREIKVSLPSSPSFFEIIKPGGIIFDLIESVRQILISPICVADISPKCNLNVQDPVCSSTKFSVSWQCDGGIPVCPVGQEPADETGSESGNYDFGRDSCRTITIDVPCGRKIASCEATPVNGSTGRLSCEIEGSRRINVCRGTTEAILGINKTFHWTANWEKSSDASTDPSPCRLIANYPTGRSVTSVSGSGTAYLNIDELRASAILYELRDNKNNLCGREIAHACLVSGTPTPSSVVPACTGLTQSGYRWYNNANSVTPGSPRASANTSASIAQGANFRLRLLLHSDGSLAASAQTMQLQYASKGSGCSSASYSNIGSGPANFGYTNNAAYSDGAAITATANDPSHSGHTIVPMGAEDSSPGTFTFANALSATEDAMVDFSLNDDGFGPLDDYCFRTVVTGTAICSISTYSVYPEITLTGS